VSGARGRGGGNKKNNKSGAEQKSFLAAFLKSFGNVLRKLVNYLMYVYVLLGTNLRARERERERVEKGEHFDVKRKQKVKQPTTAHTHSLTRFLFHFQLSLVCSNQQENGVKLKYRISEIDEFSSPALFSIKSARYMYSHRRRFTHAIEQFTYLATGRGEECTATLV
jgi:hypothetical protein